MKIKKIICIITRKHKYKNVPIDEYGSYMVICTRCGKNRDVYQPGEKKQPHIKYFKREDGKKDVK